MSAGHRHKARLSEAELARRLAEVLANPKIKARLAKPYKLIVSYDIPLLGSSGIGGQNVYLDRHLREKGPYGVMRVAGKSLDVKPGLIRHERLEQAIEDELGWPYLPLAHFVAQHWEEQDYRRKGFDPGKVEQAFAPFIKADDHENIRRCPTDLDLRPELAPPVDAKLIARIKAAQQSEKLSHSAVAYVARSPQTNRRCGKCAMFVAKNYGGPSCTLVKDEIRPEGLCRRFAAGTLGE